MSLSSPLPSEGGFIIRRAREEDLPRVIEINRRCLPEHYPEYFFRYHLDNWGEAFFVAELGGDLVGYIMNRVERGLGNVRRGIVKRGHVISIAVLEGYRKRGIGYSLMVAGMNALKNVYDCKEVYLEVRVSNTPAIKLYEKLGFVRVRVIPSYYSDGEDAYLMAREL